MGSTPEDVVIFTSKFSPYGQRVTIALREKGIPFKPIFVDIKNKPQELLDANPIWGKVPTIIHRGIPVAESLVILEYLEEAFPEKVALMPKDALGKAKTRFWADYIYKSTHEIGGKARAKVQVEYANAVLKFWKTLNDAMTDFSKDGPFFTGKEFGFLDVVLAPFTSYVLFLEKTAEITFSELKDIPRVLKWMEVISTRKSVSDTVTSNEEFLEYFMSRIQRELADGGQATAVPQ